MNPAEAFAQDYINPAERRYLGRKLFASTLVAFSGTQAYTPTRCPCQRCQSHDWAIRQQLNRAALLHRISQARRSNYLEPTIRRLDSAIANLKRFAA